MDRGSDVIRHVEVVELRVWTGKREAMIRKGTPQRMVPAALATISLLGLLAIGGLLEPLVTAPAAGAATDTGCANGVIVAVDFAHFGKTTNAVCDTPLPKNAADALVTAKFDPTGVTEYSGLSFICTISGYPRNADCATVPTGAYWEFWYAKAGANSWTYSPLGVENLVPTTGSVEGWFFGTDTGSSPPKGFASPNAMRAIIRPTTTTTTSPPTSTSPPIGSTSALAPNIGSPTTSAPPPDHATSTTAQAGATKRDRATTSTRRTTSTTTRSRTTLDLHSAHKATTKAVDPKKSSSAGIVDGAPAVAVRSSAGSPLPVVIGGVVILTLGATTWVLARRRRRAEEG